MCRRGPKAESGEGGTNLSGSASPVMLEPRLEEREESEQSETGEEV